MYLIFCMNTNSDGTLDTSHIGADYYNVRDTAHSHDVKVTLTVVRHGFNSDDQRIQDEILAYHRDDLVNNISQKLQDYGADGVSIDFENVGITNSFTGESNIVLIEQFMQVLHDTLKNANPNYHISFCVMGSVETVYRNAALAQYVDAVFLMGYDYHWQSAPTTGAVSPYNDVVNSVNTLKNYYPSNKIIIGVPFYGYDWPCSSSEPGASTTGSGTAVRMNNAIDNAQTYGRLWDSNSHTPWYRYQPDGTWHQCWYEDEESLGLKFDYANSANIGGTGFWALGYEGNNADIWDIIKKKFTSIGLSVPFYSQRDDRWGGDLLGQWGPTIKKEGCALTSVAMVMAYYGAIIDNAIANPKNLNFPEHFEEVNGHAILKWDAVNETCHSEKNELEWIGWKSVDWKEIDRELGNNYPVIVDVSCKYGQHFIVFYGKIGDEYLFYDPYDEVKTEHRWTEGSETDNGAPELGEYTINSLRIYHGVSPIEKGLQWLRDHQNPDGSWTGDRGANVGYTSLAALAFLNHGVDESDPTVSKAINYILLNRHADGSIYDSYSNYETALAILPLVATHNSDYDDEIAAARDFLIDIQIDEGEGLTNSDWPYGGWGYGWLDPSWADLSNTQWSLMGLDAANLPKMSDTWSEGELYVTRCQNLHATNPYAVTDDGGFTYQPPTISCCWGCGGDTSQSYGAMSAAGVWSLRLCDVGTADQRVQAGLNWLRNNYAPIDTVGNPCYGDTYLYYYLLSFAKTLVMTGIPAGSWQETASQDITSFIVNTQHDDGHWSSDEGDLFATEQAILALQTRTIPRNIQRLSWLTFILHSNADLHVYDSLGRHVGMNYDTGEIEIEIPNATYSADPQNITIPELITGNYRIVLIGTGTGEYTLNVTGGVGDDIVSDDSFTDTISEGEVHDANVNVAMITWLTIHVDEPAPIDPIVPSAMGTGNVSFITDSGTIVNLTALKETDLPAKNPNVDFPHGLFSFNITGLDSG
ncbi:hypothetical protein C5S31_01350, partial [ANME-1 cluster archaeon GoMg2]|nr:hypothetical protein [ANME-1 cluster archaeon GoMg2]